MSKAKKSLVAILGTVLMGSFGVLAGGVAIDTLGELPHTFVGKAEFGSLEELQVFQTQVVKDVEAANGKILSFDISTTSPPVVHYQLFVPDVVEFRYGEALISEVGATAATIGFCVAVAVLIGLVLAEIIGSLLRRG